MSLCLAGRQTKYGHKREDFKLNLHLHTDLTFDPQKTLLHCHNMLNLLQLKQLLKHMDFPSLQTLDLRKLNPTRFISQQGSTKTVKKTKPSKSGKGWVKCKTFPAVMIFKISPFCNTWLAFHFQGRVSMKSHFILSLASDSPSYIPVNKE